MRGYNPVYCLDGGFTRHLCAPIHVSVHVYLR